MSKIIYASALTLALGAGLAYANPAHHTGTDQVPDTGSMMLSGMMDGSMMGGMMHSDMMVIMLDADGDGSLSLAEFQGMHERMFGYLDANGDGTLDAGEMEAHHADAMPHGGAAE
nr:hypothetical protein [Marinicella sp. W31]MDC2877789.1 hypothetical protein [Marinicella sp. W31]